MLCSRSLEAVACLKCRGRSWLSEKRRRRRVNTTTSSLIAEEHSKPFSNVKRPKTNTQYISSVHSLKFPIPVLSPLCACLSQSSQAGQQHCPPPQRLAPLSPYPQAHRMAAQASMTKPYLRVAVAAQEVEEDAFGQVEARPCLSLCLCPLPMTSVLTQQA